MNRNPWAWALILGLAMCGLMQLHAAEPKHLQPTASQEGISVFFSPHGGCTEAVVAEIGKARKSIELQAYSFTSVPIAKAIVEAKGRGVEVTAVLDKTQRTEKYSSATFLHNADVPVFIDAKHAIAHNKIILIDGRTILTGSFNIHQGRRGKQRREPADPARQGGVVRRLRAELQGPPGAFGEVRGALTRKDSVVRETPAVVPVGPDRPKDRVVYITTSGRESHAQGCAVLDPSWPMPKTVA